MNQKGISGIFIILASSVIVLIFFTTVLIFLASKMNPNDRSLQSITSILITGFKIPMDIVTAVWEKIKNPYPNFSWWQLY